MEKAPKMWALRMGAQGFPLKTGYISRYGRKLAQDEGSDGSGPTWLRGFRALHQLLIANVQMQMRQNQSDTPRSQGMSAAKL